VLICSWSLEAAAVGMEQVVAVAVAVAVLVGIEQLPAFQFLPIPHTP
jgi:hypothetical protein